MVDLDKRIQERLRQKSKTGAKSIATITIVDWFLMPGVF